jgi:GAF domain-containing protein/HAMP domain-containing protein
MLVVILLLVVIPLAVTMAVSVYLGMNSSRDQAIRQLQSVATLKEKVLQTWVEDIHSNLNNQLPTHGELSQWETALGAAVGQDEAAHKGAIEFIKKGFDTSLGNTSVIEELFLMDAKGVVVVSTNTSMAGLDDSSRPFFQNGIHKFYINPPFNDTSVGKLSMVAALPVTDQAGRTIGTLGGRINLRKLSDLMLSREGLGQTGETYLVQKSHALLTESRFPGWAFGKPVYSVGIDDAVEKSASGYGVYLSYRGVPVLGVFHWLPDLQMALIAEQDQLEALQATYLTLLTNSAAAILSLIVTVLVALIATRRITRPIGELAKTAEQIAAGNLKIQARVEGRDEISALAESFNSMTTQLRTLIDNLEQRVAERTQEVERRSIQLQVAADIARDATSLRDLQELLNSAVDQIRDRFGFYHAGIFLVDEHHEYAVLRAAAGEAGQKMLESEHKLKIGEVGIVGYVTGTGQPRIALDVGADAAYFRNPILPETHSEMALPLKTGERVIGALDVQSKETSAFDKEDVRILQTMADQLAVAIENARLFQEMEQALRQLELSQSQAVQAAWHGFAQRAGRSIGYRFKGMGIEPLQDQLPEAAQVLREKGPVLHEDPVNGKSLAVPIKLRDEILGVINVRFQGSDLPDEAVHTYEEIATRLSLALESARLFDETRLRSDQLNLLQEITAAAASHVKVQDLLDDVAQRLLGGFNLRHCGIFLIEPEGKSVRCVTDISRDAETPGENMKGLQIQFGESGAFQQVFDTQKATVFYNAQNNQDTGSLHAMLEKRNCETLILLPLLLRGEIAGSIGLELDDRLRLISKDDQLLLDQISLQVAVAMDVARLFEKTEQRMERERLITDITSKVRASTNVDIILQTSVKELAQALHISRGAVHLKGGNGGGSDE